MPLRKYIEDVQKLYSAGHATEHSYRGALQTCISALLPEIEVTNEPKRQECGAPDYILTRKNVPIGHIEAKDVGKSLDKTEKSEQLVRYLESLDNLILTDYLEFRFYLNTEKVATVRIAEINGNQITPLPENYERLNTLLQSFADFQGQTIKSAKKLAQMMAHKAKLMRYVFHKVVTSEGESTLKDQLKAFQSVLVHDMTEEQFADVYAQTIAYGLFTARLHDTTLENFSRSESLLLIPKSNPFLRKLFSYVAGSELDERVIWIIDELCNVFLQSDLEEILKDFGSATGQKDPVLHFYETFLAEYDKSLRKARGVWYTPEPVVNFIVRAIDEVLKTHFDLPDGIADTSKTTIKIAAQEADKRTKTGRKMYEQEVHKVQLLDVATGTGTFLAEVVKQIYKRYEGQEGIWGSYVENDLLPRLNGFELLMASYAMCHMKLDLLLRETGYDLATAKKQQRLNVYLTNSLEEHHDDSHLPFANWLSQEANEASRIKRDMPIMIAFGNPPYSVSSSNKGEWIQSLIRDYKTGLNERKINLDDDYIKFIRYAEHYMEKNSQGIVAMITNNSFIDGVTHRQMRKHLLETFDDIYIYDLHGSTKKKETAPDGSKDENVFDIQQGVSISIFVKHNKRDQRLAVVHHFDSYGRRKDKYDRLASSSLKSTPFTKLRCKSPYFFFTPKDFGAEASYKKGFYVTDVFQEYNSGIQTKRDKTTISFSAEESTETFHEFLNLESQELKVKYKLPKDGRDWKIDWAKADLRHNSPQLSIINYRPFDNRITQYTGTSKGFLAYPRYKTMKHVHNKRNTLLLFCRQLSIQNWAHVFCTKDITDLNSVSINSKEQTYCAPLYLYQDNMGQLTKTPNFDPKIYASIKDKIPDVTPESLFDYIYAVLHSSAYRARYIEFLKIDFPRIPYPSDPAPFHALAEKGEKLRALHLMESDKLGERITTYPITGDHEVIKPRFKDGCVWINETQYFGGVPEIAWNFYIGGYQPAQKWLKDRKGRELSHDDITHYQRVIVALVETGKLIKEIDGIDFLPKN